MKNELVYYDGRRYWGKSDFVFNCVNGLIIDKYGNKDWFHNGLRHKQNGPAIKNVNGDKLWFQDGKKHRLDGPAIEYSNGTKYWFYFGKYIMCSSQQEFERIIKLKLFW